jgi:hypothetical protein
MLLNKTAGRVAVPIFWTLMTRWPTPELLAEGLHRCLPYSLLHAYSLHMKNISYIDLNSRSRRA